VRIVFTNNDGTSGGKYDYQSHVHVEAPSQIRLL